jgi:ABC-type ATPase with predicted acetyltransferase domain
MATVDDVQRRIQKMLQQWLGKVEIDGDGDFVFHMDSTACFGRVADFGDGDIVFNAYAPVLVDVPVTNELCKFIATEHYVLGNLWLDESDSGSTGTVFFQYRILANDLDESELKMAVQIVATTADNLDDKLQKRFGGKLLKA